MPVMFVDLGTSYSLVSVWRDGKAEVLRNSYGETLTASAVAVDEHGVLLVGLPARDRWLLKPGSGAVTFKGRMGMSQRIRVGDQLFDAVDLSALLLRELAESYTQAIGKPPIKVVIGVPAYFNGLQRDATRLAGKLAGLDVVRLVSEPTAAALAYGLSEAPENCKFGVLDLGGGTLDWSIVDRCGGLLEVLGCSGEDEHGGEDYLEVLLSMVAEQLADLSAWEGIGELHSLMWHEGERVKRLLSTADEATFTVTWSEQIHTTVITRAAFVRRSQQLLARLRAVIERGLREAGLQPQELHRVVLAGGASRMPMVQDMVKQMFGSVPTLSFDPDEAIARGGAVLTGLLDRAEDLDEVVLVDISPTTLGVESTRPAPDGSFVDGYMSALIQRSSALPVSREERFTTVVDQQRAITFNVYQGESRLVKDNLLLGALEIPVPPMPAGEAVVDVRFTYDSSCLLEVVVTQPDTEVRRTMVVVHPTATISKEQVAQRLAALAAIKVHPRDQLVNQAILARGNRVHAALLGFERERLAEMLFLFDMALRQQDAPAIEMLRSRLEPLLARYDRR